jgi:hypothetical protein
MTLRDGKYMASCKERNALAAALNGHSLVYPGALCKVAKGVAIFLREGKEVWRCNAGYAELHFKLEPIA